MVIEKDLEIIAESVRNNDIKNSKVMITGATGLLGSLLVKGFLQANKNFGLNNLVFALARNEEKAKNVFESYLNQKDLVIIKNEITENINISENVDYIFHTACVTTSKEMVAKPVELIETSVGGTINVLNFAKAHNTKSVIYLSSMEVFGEMAEYEGRLSENELGRLDLTSVRSCYPESKRLCENLCKCYSEEFGLNVCTARLTQTFGAGASLQDNRIFAMLAKNVINGEDVVLKSSGKSAHDYLYTTDAIDALLTLAKKGMAGEIYNIANEGTYASIYEMSKIVVENFNQDCKIIIENANNKMFSKDSLIKLDTSKIRALGWEPQVGLKEMYAKLIQSYKELLKQK